VKPSKYSVRELCVISSTQEGVGRSLW